jgi:hypothetical protein
MKLEEGPKITHMILGTDYIISSEFRQPLFILRGICLGYPGIPVMSSGLKSFDDHCFWLLAWFGLTI